MNLNFIWSVLEENDNIREAEVSVSVKSSNRTPIWISWKCRSMSM